MQNTLKDDPYSGHIFVFRGRFVWPVTREGKSAPDASSVIHATGGDRVVTSQTDRTA
ncbi:ISSfl4 ORF2 [Escherichia coli O32:H37 str. P4]|nr:ISSfl4 ORF2 [Escherichia coli O32:H37 str. P4]EST59964.1 ISSfl4 ORF2 [Escherichia coli ECC-Z]